MYQMSAWLLERYFWCQKWQFRKCPRNITCEDIRNVILGNLNKTIRNQMALADSKRTCFLLVKRNKRKENQVWRVITKAQITSRRCLCDKTSKEDVKTCNTVLTFCQLHTHTHTHTPHKWEGAYLLWTLPLHLDICQIRDVFYGKKDIGVIVIITYFVKQHEYENIFKIHRWLLLRKRRAQKDRSLSSE